MPGQRTGGDAAGLLQKGEPWPLPRCQQMAQLRAGPGMLQQAQEGRIRDQSSRHFQSRLGNRGSSASVASSRHRAREKSLLAVSSLTGL